MVERVRHEGDCFICGAKDWTCGHEYKAPISLAEMSEPVSWWGLKPGSDPIVDDRGRVVLRPRDTIPRAQAHRMKLIDSDDNPLRDDVERRRKDWVFQDGTTTDSLGR